MPALGKAVQKQNGRAVLRQHARFQDPDTGRLWVCLPLYEEYPEQSMEWLRAVFDGFCISAKRFCAWRMR